jgi:hypothetical protein
MNKQVIGYPERVEANLLRRLRHCAHFTEATDGTVSWHQISLGEKAKFHASPGRLLGHMLSCLLWTLILISISTILLKEEKIRPVSERIMEEAWHVSK